MWKHDGYYRDKRYLNLDKISTPENVLYCINQPFFIVQKRKKYGVGGRGREGGYFLLGHINSTVNMPRDISKYKFKPEKIKIIANLFVTRVVGFIY